MSDLHFAPLPPIRPAQLLNKRVLGYLSWHYKRKHLHKAIIQQACLDDIRSRSPDHICITGDLTNIGTPQEYTRITGWLEKLDERDKISVIPGNHDAYIREAEILIRERLKPWMGAQAEEPLPYIHKRGPVAFIGLSSAVATRPFFASGRLGAGQLNWLYTALRETKSAGLMRVVLVHHPVERSLSHPRKALDDAETLRQVIKANGAELILHGHLHHPVRIDIDGPDYQVPVFGAGAASLVTGQYYFFRLDGHILTAESRVYDESRGQFYPSSSETLTIRPLQP